MDWNIPKITGQPTTVTLNTGEPIFIVGPNGSGKSALLQQFITSHPDADFERIAAYRQTYLESGSVDMTPARRKSLEDQISRYNRRTEALWKEGTNYYGYGVHHSTILFDLVARENQRARTIVNELDEGSVQKARELSEASKSVIRDLNELLGLGKLEIAISISDDQTEILASKENASEPFSISQMSDGERNAALIAAQVLTAKAETTFLIDEPERHLHRSIIEPFLAALFERRSDCKFVVSTHEIALPIAHPGSQVIATRSCQWNNNAPIAWDFDVLAADADLPEDIKRSILGARRRVLFVEGKQYKLDVRLYQRLFPNVTVIPIGNYDDVQRAVRGIRSTQSLNHIEAFGLIDRDDRTEEIILKLADNNIYVLDAYSVESLYYCPEAIKAVARLQAETLETDAEVMIASATDRALKILGQPAIAERMARKLCVRKITNTLHSQVQDWDSVGTNEDLKIEIPSAQIYQCELKCYQEYTEQGNLDEIVARYPIRESSALKEIAKGLRFRNREDYEKAFLTTIRKDDDLADALKQRIKPLVDAFADHP